MREREPPARHSSGLSVAYWTDWAIGEPRLPGGARMLAQEWVKFGELVRRGGVYGGTRLVSQARLAELFVPSPAKPTYGISWWLPPAGSTEPDDAVTAQGAGKQRLYVIPSHRMVIVRFAENQGTWSDAEFLRRLMPAAFGTFGQGCLGTAGVPLLGDVPGTAPVIGTVFGIALASLPPGAPGATLIGGSNRFHAGLPLPLDLTGIGMPDCDLLVSMDGSVPYMASAVGTVIHQISIPNVPNLVSYSIYLQAAVLDPAANLLGVTVSNGGAMRIGTP